MTDIRLVAMPARTGESESRTNEPVTFGVPLPAGMATDGDAWAILDEASRSRPVQTRALDRWPDGSVRWLLVDARIDRQAGATAALSLRRDTPSSAGAPHAISITTKDSWVTVDTGTAKFSFDIREDFLFQSVEVPGYKGLSRPDSGLSLILADGTQGKLHLGKITARERGPLRASVLLTGRIEAGARELLRLTAWIDLFAGLSTARVRTCVTNPRRAVHRGGFWDLGDAGSLLIKELKLKFGVLRPAPGSGVAASLEVGAPWQTFDFPFEVYQDSSGGENWQSTNHITRERKVPTTFRGYHAGDPHTRSATGLRATPIVELHQEQQMVVVAVPAFWQNFPMAIVSDKLARALELALFPGQFGDVHELQGGEQKTHELFVAFGPDTVTSMPLAWTRSQTVVSVDPDWVWSTRAIP